MSTKGQIAQTLNGMREGGWAACIFEDGGWDRQTRAARDQSNPGNPIGVMTGQGEGNRTAQSVTHENRPGKPQGIYESDRIGSIIFNELASRALRFSMPGQIKRKYAIARHAPDFRRPE